MPILFPGTVKGEVWAAGPKYVMASKQEGKPEVAVVSWLLYVGVVKRL